MRAAVEAVDAVVRASASLDTEDGGGGGNKKGRDASHFERRVGVEIGVLIYNGSCEWCWLVLDRVEAVLSIVDLTSFYTRVLTLEIALLAPSS